MPLKYTFKNPCIGKYISATQAMPNVCLGLFTPIALDIHFYEQAMNREEMHRLADNPPQPKEKSAVK